MSLAAVRQRRPSYGRAVMFGHAYLEADWRREALRTNLWVVPALETRRDRSSSSSLMQQTALPLTGTFSSRGGCSTVPPIARESS